MSAKFIGVFAIAALGILGGIIWYASVPTPPAEVAHDEPFGTLPSSPPTFETPFLLPPALLHITPIGTTSSFLNDWLVRSPSQLPIQPGPLPSSPPLPFQPQPAPNVLNSTTTSSTNLVIEPERELTDEEIQILLEELSKIDLDEPLDEAGPGGCRTLRSCSAYCETRAQECQRFLDGFY